MRRPSKRARPLEYTLLYAATLFLLAIGAVMVYSASSATSLLHGSGDPSYYLKRYVIFGLLGLVVMRVMSQQGLKLAKTFSRPLLIVVGAACLLLLAQPDMGTALVTCFAIFSLLIAAGVPKQNLLKI